MADRDKFVRIVHTVARGLGRLGREQARARDITPQQAETLQLIAERGEVSTSLVATILGIDPSTASRNLAGLDRAGLVSRKRGATDGRQTDVRLSAKGRRLVDSIKNDAQKAYASLLDRLPKQDRQRVTDAIDLLSQALDANG